MPLAYQIYVSTDSFQSIMNRTLHDQGGRNHNAYTYEPTDVCGNKKNKNLNEELPRFSFTFSRLTYLLPVCAR